MTIRQLHKGDILTHGNTLYVITEPQPIYGREQLVQVSVAPQSPSGIIGATALIEFKDLKI